MAYKVGQDLYHLRIEDDGKCTLDVYKVSSINKNGTYAILISEWTWGNRAAKGKAFSKTKDIGWLPNIPTWCRKHCRPDAKFFDLHTTKRAAWNDKSNLSWLDDSPEDEVIKKRITTAIKSALTRLKKK